MAIIKILQHPDKRLRRTARPVADFGEATQKIIDDMYETLYASESCAALAATQLDFEDPLHITVIDFSEKKNEPLCLVNGQITHREGDQTSREGCMSVAGKIYEKVTRAAKIKVKAQDRHGKSLKFDADGFMAKCIQHELDHLQGRIFLDYLSPLKRRMIEQKIIKAIKKLKK